ncbi:PAS domain S-box protein [Cytophagaceae bacterium DM2B3-1]|uniref:histidine kinase n=1 Tax=Xanthocytophaga flava TaxID=3048013 RepID=A0ABT7CSG8_9BACT|nr:PAS domain S-box protein [Xanthocytophaga flavus]MDJ1496711.1 PAS domain S-box protein [Xanthocytophaga flavus]
MYSRLASLPTETILEQAPIGVLVLQLEKNNDPYSFRITYMNKTNANFLEKNQELIIGKRLIDILPDVSSEFLLKCMNVLDQKQADLLTNVSRKSTLDLKFYNVHISPIATDTVSVFSENVSDLRSIEQDLYRSNNIFQNLVREVEDYAILILDLEGNILNWNVGAENMKGYKEDEIIGKNIQVFYPDEDKASNLPQKLLEEAKQKGKIEHSGWRIRKDGSRFWANVVLTTIHDKEGKATNFIKVVRDLTQQQSTNESLRKSEQKFRSILEAAPDAMVIVNQNGIIELSNTRTKDLFGYEYHELIGQKVEILLPEQYASTHEHHRKDYEQKPRVRMMGKGIELQARCKDGSLFPVEIALSPLHIEEGVFTVAAIRDITENKKIWQQLQDVNTILENKVQERTDELAKLNNMLEDKVRIRTQQLEASNLELESFSYSISHDLRSPLRAIVGYSNILLEDHYKELSEDAKSVIDIIIKNTNRMGQLIDDILELSRISKQEIGLDTVDMEMLVQEVFQTLIKTESPSRIIHFKLDALPPTTGNTVMLRQVIINLLSNALKYSRPRTETHVHVGTTLIKNEQVYFIKDNGVGFDSRHHAKLFELFQRLHKSTEFEGTGVGLAIVHRVIQKHRGKIWAESTLGEGSCFYFTLPP